MLRHILHGKIHRCVVTESCIDYEGSITIDSVLMRAAGILENEQVHIWNVTNGERLITYAIPGPENSGMICVNGSAARKAEAGDIIIVVHFSAMTPLEATGWKPLLVFVDENNRARSPK